MGGGSNRPFRWTKKQPAGIESFFFSDLDSDTSMLDYLILMFILLAYDIFKTSFQMKKV